MQRPAETIFTLDAACDVRRIMGGVDPLQGPDGQMVEGGAPYPAQYKLIDRLIDEVSSRMIRDEVFPTSQGGAVLGAHRLVRLFHGEQVDLPWNQVMEFLDRVGPYIESIIDGANIARSDLPAVALDSGSERDASHMAIRERLKSEALAVIAQMGANIPEAYSARFRSR